MIPVSNQSGDQQEACETIVFFENLEFVISKTTKSKMSRDHKKEAIILVAD